jgi:hypothetical protein
MVLRNTCTEEIGGVMRIKERIVEGMRMKEEREERDIGQEEKMRRMQWRGRSTMSG